MARTSTPEFWGEQFSSHHVAGNTSSMQTAQEMWPAPESDDFPLPCPFIPSINWKITTCYNESLSVQVHQIHHHCFYFLQMIKYHFLSLYSII